MSQLKSRKATAADVAKEAGVSKWTVIRAFKPGASITDASRAAVLDAADRLAYRPNLLARSLSTKKTQQIAVLVDDFANPHKLFALEKLSLALQTEGLVMMLVNINQHYDHVEALLNVDQRRVDAAILLGNAFRDETLQSHRLHELSPPLFVLARESTIEDVPSVSCDAAASMREIGEHLLAQGYRRPGFMSGPQTLSTVLRRRRSFAEFWKEHGVEDMPVLPAGSYSRLAASEALRTYLSSAPKGERIDVLMCENDALAFGAMDIARSEFGLRIPEDLAIAGYDGSDLAAAPAYGLTTYRQPMEQMIAHIIDMVQGRKPPDSINLEGQLVVRGSTMRM